MNAKQKLKALVDLGLKQGDIAERVGVSQATISRILTNKHSDMKASTSDAISLMFDEHAKTNKSAA